MSIKKEIFAPLASGLGATRRAAMLLLVMMLTATTAAWATSISTINVGGTDYALYTGFTATAGTKSYANFVDGNTSTQWLVRKKFGENANDFAGGTEDPALVEFHADAPVIPKGYVLTYDNSVNENWKPTSWALKAKLNENDDWTEIHSSNSPLGNGSRFEIACNNNGDNQYQYFRFEIYDVGSTMQSILNELQIYAQFTYTPVHARAATCTEYGLTNDGYLRSDGKYFADANGTTELTVDNGLIDKIPHTGVHHEAGDGNIEYWQCSMCSKYFTDAACTQEATADEVLKTVFGTLTIGTNGASGYYTLESKTYTLTADVNTNGYIYVPEGVTATIDLNGHTIDRGLTNAITNGIVIWVAGSLTVTDSGTGGKIKGGMDSSTDHVSCVMVHSDNGSPIFTLQGGTLIGNTSHQYNNAVCASISSNITISGGKITGDARGIYSLGNITVSGGEISGNTIGIESLNYSISVSGNPVITNNTNANVRLYSSLTIAGELTVGANIGITQGIGIPTDNAPVTITSGYGTYNNNVSPSTYFSLDNNGQIQTSPVDYMTVVMGWNEDRTEIAVGTALYTVNFDMNGHGDDIDAVSLLSGYKVAEPTKPTADDWLFFGWYTDDACTSQWNFNNAVTSNMTLHALWTQEAIYSFTLPEKMVIVSTTNAPVGGKYPVGTVIKFKVSSADYVVDGDVSDGTNTLTPDGDGNYTITMGDADITITATIKKAVEPNKTLSGSENYEAQNGDVLTGSTSGTVTIANNATITLSDVTITGGIVCAGTAEITLVGTNSVTGASQKAGIQVGGSGTTLTIKGNGSLTANGGSQSAGIGLSRAWDVNATGGDIIIEGGNITATGDKYGAGIGTGVCWGDVSDKTATLGNITIKGGTVRAIGGTNNGSGIGKGHAYSYGHAVVGTITIYDGINLVDASSISESVVYKHGENDVTASKSDYFTITEDGNRRVIEPKDDTDYTITIANGIEHGTLTGAATAKYMEKVTITATPALGYRFSRLVVKDAQNNDVASTGNSFFMPKSNVTVSAVFEQGIHGTTEFDWGFKGDYYNPFNKEATIYDGVTTVSVSSGKTYTIYNNEESFRLDEDPGTFGRDIPYSGGTGSFMMGGYGEFRLNGDAGFYDITMTDVGNGKWNVSILKTAGQMDVVPDQTYTGCEITPEPLVIAGSLSLTKGTDYVYSYTNNTNVGTATVRATFQGTYASLGYVEKTFTIVYPTVSYAINKGTVKDGDIAFFNDESCKTPITTAVMDQTVYIKVTPDNGYELNGITAQTTVPSVNAESRRSTPATTTIPLDGQVAVTLVDGTTDVYKLTMPPANVEVAATFTPVVYSIVYDLGGGSVATDNPTSYTIESDPITLVNPTLEGYTFGGWTGSNVDTPQTEVTIVTGQTGNRNYKAVWYTEATVQVAWEDMDDHDGIRPVSVTATLSDGTEVTLSSSNSWTSTVTNLPAFDIEGQAIVYTWTESEVDGYELVGSTTEDGATTLTYSHTPTVTLTIGSGGWATYYHEDGLTYSVSDGAQAYYVSSIGNGVVNLTAIDGVPSSLPVLISGSGTVTLTAGATEVEVSDNDARFQGTPTALSATDFTDFAVGRTYVLYKGVFLLADTNSGIGAHKCWLTLSGSNARQLNLNVGDDTTGLSPCPIPADAPTRSLSPEGKGSSCAWYDLQGRKLGSEPTRKGLYIYKGKKVKK